MAAAYQNRPSLESPEDLKRDILRLLRLAFRLGRRRPAVRKGDGATRDLEIETYLLGVRITRLHTSAKAIDPAENRRSLYETLHAAWFRMPHGAEPATIAVWDAAFRAFATACFGEGSEEVERIVRLFRLRHPPRRLPRYK